MGSSDTLRAAKARISDPHRWVRGALACDQNGKPTEPRYDDACRWCAYGAMYAENADPLSIKALEDAAHSVFGEPPEDVNDCLTHSDVMEMFDRAIQIAEQAP